MVSVLDGDEGLMILLCRHPQDDVLGNPVQDRLRHRPSSPTAPAFQSSTGWYSRGENSAGESEIFPTLPRTWASVLSLTLVYNDGSWPGSCRHPWSTRNG